MDNGSGRFEEVTPGFLAEQLKAAGEGLPNRLDKIFSEGEQVQIKNSKFLVRSIDPLTGIMTLKLLPEKRF